LRKKSKIEEVAKKIGEVLGKGARKGWRLVKGLSRGFRGSSKNSGKRKRGSKTLAHRVTLPNKGSKQKL